MHIYMHIHTDRYRDTERYIGILTCMHTQIHIGMGTDIQTSICKETY